jgi:hypothetical protein
MVTTGKVVSPDLDEYSDSESAVHVRMKLQVKQGEPTQS